MNFTSGYYFFETQGGNPACGYVLLRYVKSMLKIQCVAENIAAASGRSALLRVCDSLNMEKPYTLGRMYFNGSGELLRGEQNFTLNRRNLPAFGDKYDCIELVSEQTRAQIMRTKPSPRQDKDPEIPKVPFDPFNTTNSAYSWSRAVRVEQLRRELMGKGIHPSFEVADEMKEAMNQYLHILLGNYTPHNTGKKYFLLGIPCKQPENTPNKIYRWINKCVELPEYPEFDGYKLYYYDMETGAAVKAVLKS